MQGFNITRERAGRTMRFLAFVVGVSTSCSSVPPSAAHPSLTHELTLMLPSDRGELVKLPVDGAKATVADFFSPTCEPCRKKVPELWAQRSALEARGAKLVLVAVLGGQESTADAQKALAEWGAHDATFLVDTGDASKREGVRDLPTTMVVDAHGVVRWVAPADAKTSDVVSAARSVADD